MLLSLKQIHCTGLGSTGSCFTGYCDGSFVTETPVQSGAAACSKHAALTVNAAAKAPDRLVAVPIDGACLPYAAADAAAACALPCRGCFADGDA